MGQDKTDVPVRPFGSHIIEQRQAQFLQDLLKRLAYLPRTGTIQASDLNDLSPVIATLVAVHTLGYQVDGEMLSKAKENAILMHPLPAHHGEEVAENLIYSGQSVVFDQAENRMHAQKALLADILGGLEISLPGYR